MKDRMAFVHFAKSRKKIKNNGIFSKWKPTTLPQGTRVSYYPLALFLLIIYTSSMVDKNNKNLLEELYTDSGQMDQAVLLSILKPYIRLHKDSSTVIYTQVGIGLSAAKKIILLFL